MAGKIYITGDTHRRLLKFIPSRFLQQKDLDKEDYVIICGDFGVVWDVIQEKENPSESWEETKLLDWIEQLPFTLLFVDGNHENFDRLNAYPVEKWHGGNVHKIRSSVIHLMRGQVFEIAGKKIFTFGGARSHDISGGILEVNDPNIKEKINELEDIGALFRINHVSWWKEEMPSETEMREGLENLAKHGNKVDYIISHCCSGEVQSLIDKRLNEQNELTNYFDSIRHTCEYKKWYFGHYHEDRTITSQDVLLYHRIIELGNDVDEMQPILGKPKYEMYQPVKFLVMEEKIIEEKVGVIAIRDPFGTYLNPDEPSYDIFAKWQQDKEDPKSTTVCLFKHIPESAVKAISDDEIMDYADVIMYIVKEIKRK